MSSRAAAPIGEFTGFLRKGGRLCSLFPLVSWVPGCETITLDGEFTPEVLRAIADHVERRRAINAASVEWL